MSSWTLNAKELEIIQDLNKESDRAAAIIAVTLIESRLQAKLCAHFRSHKEAETNLFGISKPLSGFAAKNDLGLLMRFYGKPVYKDLQILNNIRNKFAHYFEHKGELIKDFKSSSIAALCAKLSIVKGYVSPKREWKNLSPEIRVYSDISRLFPFPGMAFTDNPEAILDEPRQRFLSTASILSTSLGMGPLNEYHHIFGDETPPAQTTVYTSWDERKK